MTEAGELDRVCREAAAAWPEVDLDPARFREFVVAQLPPDGDLRAVLSRLRGGDLWLACACACANGAALEIFERDYIPVVAATLRGMRASDTIIAEISQTLREQLLVGDRQRRPRVADYAGRGSLRQWVRAVAARTYLNSLRASKRSRELADQELLDNLATPEVDPELAYMKELYCAELAAAFRQALAGLAAGDRNTLRYYYVEELGLGEIATIYGVSRATAHRRLVAARAALARATEARLCEQLQVEPAAVASIRRLVQSQLELTSLGNLLGAG